MSSLSVAKELQHDPELESFTKEILLPGPNLKLSGKGDKKLFLLVPRDVRIDKAIIEAESVPIQHTSQTYSVRELFENTGEWGFTTQRNSGAVFLTLNGNQDHASEASGVFNVVSSDHYEIQMQVFQGTSASNGRAILVTIDDKSKILGTKGPATTHLWETWGTVLLKKGEHHITIGTAPESLGYWEVGPLRLRPVSSMSTSFVRDLRIVFGKSDRPHYSVVTPKGRFQTPNLASKLSHALALQNYESKPLGSRDIVPISIASSSAGQLHIHKLNLLVTIDSKEKPEQETAKFLLIGPEVETSRDITAPDIEALFGYLENLETAGVLRGDHSYVTEALQVYDIISELAAASSDVSAAKTIADCERKIEKLAGIEAKWLTHLFIICSYDWPKPSDFPANWLRHLSQYNVIDLDEDRLTSDGSYLDPWGNPYLITYKSGKITLFSFGPNGRNDKGQNDDIIAIGECNWE